jgi:hypothetical protein
MQSQQSENELHNCSELSNDSRQPECRTSIDSYIQNAQRLQSQGREELLRGTRPGLQAEDLQVARLSDDAAVSAGHRLFAEEARSR